MLKIFLSGATGAMGKTIIDITKNDSEFKVVSGFGKEYDDKDIKIYKDFKNIEEDFDVIIDFSTPIILDRLLKFAKEKNKPLVLATTGFDREDMNKIEEFSKYIPILQTGNTSLGIHAIKKATKILTQILFDFDVEIVEAHHNKKKDSPSGTAKMLLESVKEIHGDYNEVLKKDSNYIRDKKDIGVYSLRGGTIVGEHSVVFAGIDEVIEIKHKALSKKIFAKGALNAGKKLLKMENGLYKMDDIF